MRLERRLAAEGTMIVVSILLAFALDAAWDRSPAERSLRERLVQLRGQLTANRTEAERALAQNDATLSRLERFLRSDPETLAALPEDSIAPIARSLLTGTYYSQGGGLVEALVASGALEGLQDPDLRARLTLWSTVASELDEDEQLVTERTGRVANAIAGHGVWAALSSARGTFTIWSAPDLAAAMIDLRTDREAVDLVTARYLALRSYNANLRGLLESFDRIAIELADY